MLTLVGLVLAAATRLPTSLRAPRCAPVVCQQPPPTTPQPSPPIALRSLDRQEVLDKLNAVPAFGIVNGAEQLVAELDEEGNPTSCCFYLDVDEAQSQVHRALSFDLCPTCWTRFVKDPLAGLRGRSDPSSDASASE